MNLPEKLRNLGILPPPKEKVKVMLSEIKTQALHDILFKPSKKIKEASHETGRRPNSKEVAE